MRILNSSDVKQALPMKDCIEAMKLAYIALVEGKAEVPLRTRLPIASQNAVSLFMPAYVQGPAGDALTIKIVSIFPNNLEHGLAFIQAAVLVLDPNSGKPVALLEGSSLTAIRTGAGSGAATQLLSRNESRVAAIFGAGAQGRTQLEAICNVRDIQTVWLYDTDQSRANTFIQEMAGKPPIPADIRIANNPSQAISDADIICCATTATSPVFSDQDIKPGAHINAIGSYTPEMQETPSATVARALVIVDSRSASLAETGDLLRPIQEGLMTQDHIYAELGEIALVRKPGRTDSQQITYFKSVGLAVQDALAAQLALANSEKLNLGQLVQF
jgi:ornithine cyclodeaminase/alanine dehydrogenase-like protein (mu-crystallin family)